MQQKKPLVTTSRKATKRLTKAHKSSRLLLGHITLIVKASDQTHHEKIHKIEQLIDDYEKQKTELERLKLIKIETSFIRESDENVYQDSLEAQLLKLQRKVGYKALKEFGRIIKTIFILSYYDDVQLRQRIEKQLNKVELSLFITADC